MQDRHKSIFRVAILIVICLSLVLLLSSNASAYKIWFQGNGTIYDNSNPFDLGYTLTSANSSDGYVYVSGILGNSINCYGGIDCPYFTINTDASDTSGTTINRADKIQFYYLHTPSTYIAEYYPINYSWEAEQNITFLLKINTNNHTHQATWNGTYVGEGRSSTNSSDGIQKITLWNGESNILISDLTIYTQEVTGVLHIFANDYFNNSIALQNFSAKIDYVGGVSYYTYNQTNTNLDSFRDWSCTQGLNGLNYYNVSNVSTNEFLNCFSAYGDMWRDSLTKQAWINKSGYGNTGSNNGIAYPNILVRWLINETGTYNLEMNFKKISNDCGYSNPDGTNIYIRNHTNISLAHFILACSYNSSKNLTINAVDLIAGQYIYYYIDGKNNSFYDAFDNARFYAKKMELINTSSSIVTIYYNTTTGTIVTNITSAITPTANITISSDENGGYFNKTYINWDVNNNLTALIHQTEVIVIGKEKITNNTISGTLKINGITDTNSSLFLRANTIYNLSFSNTSYLNNQIDYNNTIPALFNGTISILGFYNTVLNVTLKDKITSASILNFSGYVNLTNSFSESFNVTDSSGLARINLIKNLNYTVFVQAFNYSIGTNNFQTVNITNNNTLVNFLLYTANSVFVYIYDVITHTLININETIQLTTANTTATYYTQNGTYNFPQLSSAVYTFRFISPSATYSTVSYMVTVGNSNTQILNVSLQSTNYSTILAFVDSATQNPLNNVSVNVYKQTENNEYVLTQSGLADISGRFAVYYTPYTRYLFQTSLNGYNSLAFYLDPILYSSYTISMVANRSNNYTGKYSTVFISYFPKNFKTGLNNLTMMFQSASGSLVNYGYNLSFPTGTETETVNNANGETLTTTNFNISTSNFADTVNITYWYTSTVEGYSTKTDVYYINRISANNTFITNQDNHYGLGNLELVLIITVITILIVGIVSIAVGSLFGIAIGIFMWFYFSYMGLMPFWLILVPAIIGFFIIIIRGSNQ